MNEIPGTIALDLLLGRTDEIAVALGGMAAYSTGLQFDLRVRQKTSTRFVDDRGPQMRLHEQVMGARGRGGGGDDALLLGFGYPDGRTVTNVGAHRSPWEESDDAPILHPGSGGGDHQAYDASFWLSPLPRGDLAVICAWPARGVEEFHGVIGRRIIEDAVARVVELWPWSDDEEPRTSESPRLPKLPSDSWFTTALGDQSGGSSQ